MQPQLVLCLLIILGILSSDLANGAENVDDPVLFSAPAVKVVKVSDEEVFFLRGIIDLFPAGVVALNENEFILGASGWGGTKDRRGSAQIVLEKVKSPGFTDWKFGERGRAIVNLDAEHIYYSRIKLDHNGNIVMGGSGHLPHKGNFHESSLFVSRFLANGQPDSRFGDGGTVQLNVGPGSINDAHGLDIDANGRIVQAGNSYIGEYLIDSTNKKYGGSHVFSLRRYLQDGSPDTSYGHDGAVLVGVGKGSKWNNDSLRDLLIEESGELVTAGQADHKFAVAKFKDDGSLDISFADKGIYLSEFSKWGSEARSIAVDHNHFILAGGSIALGRHYTEGEFAIVRLDREGKPDLKFGDKGVVRILRGRGQRVINSIAVQPDGKILFAGDIPLTINKRGVLVGRLNNDGELDKTFADDGILIVEIGEGSSFARNMLVLNSGKIVISGGYRAPDWGGVFLMHVDNSGKVKRRTPMSPNETYTKGPECAGQLPHRLTSRDGRFGRFKELNAMRSSKRTGDSRLPYAFNYDTSYVISINHRIPDAQVRREKLAKLLIEEVEPQLIDKILFEDFGDSCIKTVSIVIGSRIPVKVAQAVVSVFSQDLSLPITIDIRGEDAKHKSSTQIIYVGSLAKSEKNPINREAIDALLRKDMSQKQFIRAVSELK